MDSISLRAKLFSIIGILLFLSVLICIAAIMQITRIQEEVDHISEVEEPLSFAAHEMEINVIGMGFAVMGYLHEPDEKDIDRIKEDEKKFLLYFLKYRNHSESLINGVSDAKLEALFRSYQDLAWKLIRGTNRKNKLLNEQCDDFILIDNILDDQIQTESESDGPLIRLSTDLENDLNEYFHYYKMFLEKDDPQLFIAFRGEEKEIRKTLRKLQALDVRVSVKEKLERIGTLFEKNAALSNEVINLIRNEQNDIREFVKIRRTLDNILDDEIQYQTRKKMMLGKQRVKNTAKNAKRIILIVFGVSLLFGVFAGGVFLKAISRPMNRLIKAMKLVAQGDLTTSISSSHPDEFGFLSETFNRMVEDLNRTTIARKYFENIVNSMAEALIVSSPDGTIEMVNPAACRLLEYSRDELEGLPCNIILQDEKHDLFVSADDTGKTDHSIQTSFRTKNNSLVPVSFSVSPMENGTEEKLGFVIVAECISERLLAEEALRKSEKKFRMLTQRSPVGIFLDDADGKAIFINEKCAELVGVPAEDALDFNWLPLIHPDDRNRVMDEWEKTFRAGGEFHQEYRWIHRNGRVVWTKGDIVPVRDQYGRAEVFIGTLTDITDQKQAEADLVQSRQRYQTLFDESPVPLWEEDFSDLKLYFETLRQRGIDDFRKYFDEHPEEVRSCIGKIRILNVNQAVLSLHGFKTREDLISGLSGIFTEKFLTVFKEELISIASGKTIFESEAEVKTITGEPLNILLKLKIDTEGNEPGRVLLATTDITALKRSEELGRRLLAAIDQVGESVIITDSENRIIFVNPAFEIISGYTREEVLGRNPRFLKSGIQDETVYQEMWRTIGAGKTWRGRFVNKRKDGSLFTEDAVISSVRDEDGSVVNYFAIKRDITDNLRLSKEKESLEKQLAQAMKLEAIGRLVGGIAHDFNNMLSVILGYTDMMKEEMDPDIPLYRDINEIHSVALKSADLTRQLLAFSRQQPISPKILNINDLIESSQNMLARLIGEDISLKFIPERDLWRVRMDPSQIDQILVNLAVNAREAIRGTGSITIETKNVNLDTEYCRQNPGAQPGEHIRITFSDTGSGMDDNTLEKMFEPFFTTKPEGKGTGLGLAVIYGIVRQNDGHITVESKVGVGTKFHIFFPGFGGKLEGKKSMQKEETIGGEETILFVDDAKGISKLFDRVLTKHGYTVLPASHPMEALHLVEQYNKPVHLLVTDIIMPEMDGKELYEKILRIKPDIQVLFISGYMPDKVKLYSIETDQNNFLKKPFKQQDLLRKIRQILDKKK